MLSEAWRVRLVRWSEFLGCVMAAVVVMLSLGADAPFREPLPTAAAALLLIVSLPLVDSALFGSRTRPGIAGACFGLGMGFLLRQSEASEPLAAGAERVAAVILALSLIGPIARSIARASRRASKAAVSQSA